MVAARDGYRFRKSLHGRAGSGSAGSRNALREGHCIWNVHGFQQKVSGHIAVKNARGQAANSKSELRGCADPFVSRSSFVACLLRQNAFRFSHKGLGRI